MIIEIANKWADWIVSNGADKDEHEVYVYGAECMLNELVSNVVLIIIALALNKLPEMVVWSIIFTPLRVKLGGFHASSHFKCILYSTLICFFCIYTGSFLIANAIVFYVGMAVCFITVFKFAPVVHPNHPVSEEKFIKTRKEAFITCSVEIVVLVITYILFSKTLGELGAISMLSACFLAFMGKLFNPKSE